MAYVRKTRDLYAIQGYYGSTYGWEDVTIEESARDAREMLACYNTNERSIPHRIRKFREKI